jgi:hypothetical protein
LEQDIRLAAADLQALVLAQQISVVSLFAWPRYRWILSPRTSELCVATDI